MSDNLLTGFGRAGTEVYKKWSPYVPPMSATGAVLRVMWPRSVASGTLTPEQRQQYLTPIPAEERLRAATQEGGRAPSTENIATEISLGGNEFGNFLSLKLKRDKKEMCPSGSITLGWPGAEMFNEREPKAQQVVDGARGEIWLDGQLAATIMIDKRSSKGSPKQYRLELTFRGVTSGLVDSTAKPQQFNKKNIGEVTKEIAGEDKKKDVLIPMGERPRFGPPTAEGVWPTLEQQRQQQARELLRGFGPRDMEPEDIQDMVDSGEWDMDDDLPIMDVFVTNEGETKARAMRRATREYGYNLEENEQGKLVLKKKGANEGTGQDFVLGKNFTEWTVKRDIAPRHKKVKAKGKGIPSDERYGKDVETRMGEAIDEYRQLAESDKEHHVIVDSDHNFESLKKRAVSEANRRKGTGLDVAITVPGFSDDQGRLWKTGRLHRVVIPIDQIDDTLMISNVEFTLDKESGKGGAGSKKEAKLTLVSPETFSDKKKDTGKGVSKGDFKMSEPTVKEAPPEGPDVLIPAGQR